MIKTVIRLQNGEVMVFDADGEQLPEYQGRYQQVREGILRDAAPEAVFCHWFGTDESQPVSKASW